MHNFIVKRNVVCTHMVNVFITQQKAVVFLRDIIARISDKVIRSHIEREKTRYD